MVAESVLKGEMGDKGKAEPMEDELCIFKVLGTKRKSSKATGSKSKK